MVPLSSDYWYTTRVNLIGTCNIHKLAFNALNCLFLVKILFWAFWPSYSVLCRWFLQKCFWKTDMKCNFKGIVTLYKNTKVFCFFPKGSCNKYYTKNLEPKQPIHILIFMVLDLLLIFWVCLQCNCSNTKESTSFLNCLICS